MSLDRSTERPYRDIMSKRHPIQRSAVTALLVWTGLWGAGLIGVPSPARTDPAEIGSFLYQLQEIDLAAIARTCYDLVVIDYSADGSEHGEFAAEQIAKLAESPTGHKIVLAYLSIGEAESYRFYWKPEWRPGHPFWLDAENPSWDGNYKVRFWVAEWQRIVLRYVDRLIDAGFHGAYLDLIDAYQEYKARGRDTAATEMIAFVEAIRVHALARDPGFLLFVQNAAALLDVDPTYVELVDGIGQEDIHYGYLGDDLMTPPAVTAYMVGRLDRFLAAGKPVLTIDYATTPTHIDRAYVAARANGYVAFVTTRALDTLVVHPGHDPCAD